MKKKILGGLGALVVLGAVGGGSHLLTKQKLIKDIQIEVAPILADAEKWRQVSAPALKKDPKELLTKTWLITDWCEKMHKDLTAKKVAHTNMLVAKTQSMQLVCVPVEKK